jgi:hypothetical protein
MTMTTPPRRRWSYSLKSIFWLTTALAFFFATWSYLPMASAWSRFWYSWSATFLGLVVIRMAKLLWDFIRSRSAPQL